MNYYISTTLTQPFDKSIEMVIEALKKEGFGVLADIDVQSTMKTKLNVDFRKYRILGACNPPFALKALEAEDKIGVFLPCNVIVQERDSGTVEVSAVDPVSSMQAVDNEVVESVAEEIREKLKFVIAALEKGKKL
ncbi:MAG: DUF302 domain-containing protein [Sphaerochaetaceae bacterium]|nr:DUF302 domain-containing protein [Sphaerochaetaceae bacterium]